MAQDNFVINCPKLHFPYENVKSNASQQIMIIALVQTNLVVQSLVSNFPYGAILHLHLHPLTH
jgi:hypothetical protein